MDNENKKLPKVLIIEDEETLTELLSDKLKSEGYTVACAGDGEAGYNKIKEEKPDLILLDIVMPKMDGYEVLEKMKEEKVDVPVIIISNSGQPVEIEKTRKLGAVDHLIKTEFSPEDVLKKAQKFLGSQLRPDEIDDKIEPVESNSKKHLGISVLLVEDDPFLREICSNKLSNDGYTVYTAIDGEKALRIINEIKPDLVLLDIVLPSIDGFQILHQIRSHDDETITKTPVIMLSNLGQESDIKKAMDMGANDFLVKAHFTTEEIAKKINNIMKESPE
jgi:DNA-binding response OmpR family regulator